MLLNGSQLDEGLQQRLEQFLIGKKLRVLGIVLVDEFQLHLLHLNVFVEVDRKSVAREDLGVMQ
jgi:hypothetical protein